MTPHGYQHTFRVSQLKRREVVTENLRVCVVAFTVTTTAAQIATSSRSCVGFVMIPLTGLSTFLFFSIKPLLQGRNPRVDFGLSV